MENQPPDKSRLADKKQVRLSKVVIRMSKEYKKVENIRDIKIAYYITVPNKDNEALIELIRNNLNFELHIVDDILESKMSHDIQAVDIFFIDHKINKNSDAGRHFCNYLRKNGYKGMIILCTRASVNEVSSYLVTTIGFDNFLPLNSNLSTLFNQIHWGILNRRRKNKSILQYDNNPEALYTIAKDGTIYDINDTALNGSRLTPKEVVNNKKKIWDIATLPTFDEHIQPLITANNTGMIFEHSSSEGDQIYQVKVNIANLPIIGLVATIFKTDISHVMFSRTMDILTNSIELLSHRDNYTAGHSSRVFHYCVRIAEKMGLSLDKNFTKGLYCAALLHDIGKIGVKDKILLKPGRLSSEEYKELFSHPTKGCNMLRRYKLFEDSIYFIKSHHERPDGKGYPDKLHGKDIPVGALIISVADSFDAMTSNRPYRKSLNFKKAVKEVKNNFGKQFDIEVASAFLSIISPNMLSNIKIASHKTLEKITREILDLLKGIK